MRINALLTQMIFMSEILLFIKNYSDIQFGIYDIYTVIILIRIQIYHLSIYGFIYV
jgi:hypothetical protein